MESGAFCTLLPVDRLCIIYLSGWKKLISVGRLNLTVKKLSTQPLGREYMILGLMDYFLSVPAVRVSGRENPGRASQHGWIFSPEDDIMSSSLSYWGRRRGQEGVTDRSVEGGDWLMISVYPWHHVCPSRHPWQHTGSCPTSHRPPAPHYTLSTTETRPSLSINLDIQTFFFYLYSLRI